MKIYFLVKWENGRMYLVPSELKAYFNKEDVKKSREENPDTLIFEMNVEGEFKVYTQEFCDDCQAGTTVNQVFTSKEKAEAAAKEFKYEYCKDWRPESVEWGVYEYMVKE